MSNQRMKNPEDPNVQKELRGRLHGVLSSAAKLGEFGEGEDDQFQEARSKFLEEVKSLYFALTGVQMNEDQLKEVIG